MTNDLIGDGGDRWETGSYASSYAFGRSKWRNALPDTPGEVLELRLDASIASPDNLRSPDPGDRPLAGMLRFTLATQFDMAGWETDLGAHLSFVGPETGLVDLQTGLHEILPGASPPSKAVRNAQVDLDPSIGFSGEIARPIPMGGTTLRPFLAIESGVETLARAGVDFRIGHFGTGGLVARERISGQRYGVINGPDGPGAGFTFVFGGDVAFLDHTDLLRDQDGVAAEWQRNRLRAGLHWQQTDRHLFYGATWLSPETEAQDSWQAVGSLRVQWRF